MKKLMLPLVCSMISLISLAQKQKTVAVADKDNAAKYATLITEAGLKKHLSIIASDSMEGRETGTAGQRRAAEYIQKQFESMGLKHPSSMEGYQQSYPIGKDTILEAVLNVDGSSYQWGVDFIPPITLNASGSFNANKIVFAGYGIDDAVYSDYDKLDVKGKVLLLLSGEPKKDGAYFIGQNAKASAWTNEGMIKKAETAQQKGAVGILYINLMQEAFNPSSARYNKATGMYFPFEEKEKGKIPVVQITHAAAQKIMGDEMKTIIGIGKSYGFMSGLNVEKNISTSFKLKKESAPIYSSNVLGVLEGSEKKDEYLMLTAHYDHLGIRNGKVYNGADDDGSGTVAVLQMAEAFVKAAKEGKRPKRNIIFMLVSGEEKGLWGSEYYTDHPIFPLEKTTADLNTDMIGRIDTERKKDDTLNYVYVVGHDKLSTELPIINEGVNNKYTKLVSDYRFDDPKDPNRIYYRSDHYNFARKGVPVLFFYDGMLKSDYHQPTDDVDKINWPLYAKRAKMIFHTAWDMANKKEMLKRDLPKVADE